MAKFSRLLVQMFLNNKSKEDLLMRNKQCHFLSSHGFFIKMSFIVIHRRFPIIHCGKTALQHLDFLKQCR